MKDPTRYRILLALLFFFLSYPTSPQSNIPEKIQFKHLTKEEGLSDNSSWGMIQDRKGFIWIGTPDGLNRYDGRKFKIFKHSIDDPNSLGANSVQALWEDKSGVLWIGTLGGGLNKYNPEQENFTRYVNPYDSSKLANSIITIYEDKSGILWIGMHHGGLNMFDSKSEKFITYKNIPDDSTSISNNIIWTISEDSKGNLWIGTVGGGLNKFNRENKTFTRYLHNPKDPTSLSHNEVVNIREDKSGAIWVSTSGGGLNKFTYKDDKQLPLFKHLKYDQNNPSGLPNNYIDYMLIDKNNVMWIGTEQGGLSRTISSLDDMSKLSFISYKHVPLDQFSLSSNEIPYIYPDNSGLFWITTQGGGVNNFNLKQKQFRNYKQKQDDPLSLGGSNVTSVYEDKDGVIWIGTWDGGLNKWDRAKNKFAHYKHIPNDPTSLSTNRVTVIYEDKSGVIWVGTWNQGLNKFDKRTGKFYTYWHDPSNVKTISDNLIYSINEDKSGVLWIGTANGGLCTYDRESDSFIHFNYKYDSTNILSSTHSSSIYLVDKSGTLWISADDGGLISVNFQNNEFIHYKHQPNNPNSLSNDVVTDVYEDKSGFFWIGTSGGGLNKFDKVNGLFRCYLTKDGLPSDNITGVLEDDNGNLWITTNDGLSKFNPQLETFRNYDIEDGLSSISLVKGCKIKTGEMILGSDKGFVVFYPDSIKDNTHVPPVYITDFYLFNKPVPIGYDSLSGRTILSKSIIECDEIELNYDDEVFSFEFAALDFQAPMKNMYAYIMEGFDKDWTYTDADRNLATYTNLDPGEYVFRVKGSNNDGYWNETGASIKIIILPPWWRTNLAYLIYFLLIGSIIYVTWKAQLKRLKNKHEYEMSKFEAQKLHEVDELKSRFFTNISHEFRTPLTLILGPVKQMIEKLNEGKMKDDLGIVHRNANKLLELVNQLLDISKLESGNMKLQTVPQNIVPLVKALALSFTSYAERKTITLKFTSSEAEIVVYIDKDKIEKIITNILSNAFKFTPEGGTIEVTVRKDERNSNIIISDTGVGIPKEKISKIFDRFYQVDGSHTREQEGSGVGLSLTKELVELHRGKIEVESEEGKGSTFAVSIPLGKEHLSPEEIVEKEKAQDFEDEKLKPVYDEEIERKCFHYVELYENESLPVLLLIEDNSDVRNYIKINLNNDYKVLEAVDGEDGWNKSVEQIPDLIVSDVMMPKMDGFKLCEKLKTDERTSHIPIILLTAKAAKEDKLEGYETGADEYIMKPFEPDELRARIKNLIQQRKRLHEHFKRQGIIDFEKSKIASIDKKFLQKALDIINKNISHSEFGVEVFAELLNVSRSVLHRKIVSLTGESPGDLIRYIRLKKASQLIEQKFGNITEISLEVGFNNPGQFARSFQKQFGVSPSTYSQKFDGN